MEELNNAVESDELVLILHGASKGINSEPVTSIFNRLKTASKRVSAIEFSFITKKTDPDPDQIVETEELENYLKAQRYKRLTVIAHSNGGLVALVATTRGLVINHLILLGLTSVTKEGTKQIIAEIVRKITSEGNRVTIIQPENDPYSTPLEVKNFINEFDLDVELYTIPGDHYFRGAEPKLSDLIYELVSATEHAQ
ncbi:MAG: hypothetical protein HYS89_00710 [Candidatus Colwellbacteria bacterium]|nr:hypothetical protein [Candidatus Colwellbacteria bacterium]